MNEQSRSPHRIIWVFAFGYLLAYAPYAAMTKVLSAGGAKAFELLPAAILGTLITLPLILTSLGWWKYAAMPDRTVMISGVGTAVIIVTTTLAYTFDGVSIVLALLLMRGGVLVLAPLVDVAFGRNVRWFSWTALVLCLAAVAIALRGIDRRHLTLGLGLVLAVYLGGYVLRLSCMTRAAKVRDDDATRRYFVGEAMAAMIALGVALLFLRRDAVFSMPGILTGALYSVLFVFGTLIYLDRRENTFCIPLNRASSLLAGVLAAGVLHAFYGFTTVPASQAVAAAMMVATLLLLSPAHHALEVARGQRTRLFICSGNTCRSPIAEAIANAELTARFGGKPPAHAVSAGIAAKSGAPMTDASRAALRLIDVEPHEHAARLVTPDVVDAASLIYCMTAGQRDSVIQAAPAAAAKTLCLDPDGDVPDPIGQPVAVYADTARRIQHLVRLRFDQAGLRA